MATWSLSLGWTALSSLMRLLFWLLFIEFKATTFTYPAPVPYVQFTKSHILTLKYPANTWNIHFKSIVIFPWNFDFSIFLRLLFTILKVIFGSSFYIIYNLWLRSEVLLNWIPIVLIIDTRRLLSDKNSDQLKSLRSDILFPAFPPTSIHHCIIIRKPWDSRHPNIISTKRDNSF